MGIYQFTRNVASNIELAHKLEELENKYNTNDKKITAIFEAIGQLIALPEKKKNPISF